MAPTFLMTRGQVASLILRQPNYTITAWCRWDKRTTPGTWMTLYRTCVPDRLNEHVFAIGLPLERSVHVNAWNGNLLPEYWK